MVPLNSQNLEGTGGVCELENGHWPYRYPLYKGGAMIEPYMKPYSNDELYGPTIATYMAIYCSSYLGDGPYMATYAHIYGHI